MIVLLGKFLHSAMMQPYLLTMATQDALCRTMYSSPFWHRQNITGEGQLMQAAGVLLLHTRLRPPADPYTCVDFRYPSHQLKLASNSLIPVPGTDGSQDNLGYMVCCKYLVICYNNWMACKMGNTACHHPCYFIIAECHVIWVTQVVITHVIL